MTVHESRDDILFRQLTSVVRHLRSCRKCQTAKKANAPEAICPDLQQVMFTLAFRLDDIVKLRRQAHEQVKPFIFVCPDVSKHGKAYAMTALPMSATGIQGRLC